MSIYILRRLLLMIPTLLGITVLVFAIMAATPGGISSESLIDGQDLNPQERAALQAYYNKLYGLDQPAPMQYLRWLNNLLPIGFVTDEDGHWAEFSLTKGVNLGRSFISNRPVADLLAERLPITMLLNVLSIPIIYLIAITIGVRAARFRGQAADTQASMIMLALWSFPVMLAGVLLIGFFASEQYWHWFPPTGLSERQAHAMAFLPSWQYMWQAVVACLAPLLGFAAGLAFAHWHQRWSRVLVAAVLGAGLGWLMAQASNTPLPFWGWILPLGLAGLLAWVAVAEFMAIRVATFGLTGLLLASVLALQPGLESMERGFLFDRLWHLVLPLFCMSFGGFAFLSRLTRGAVLENILADYARTARAKGLSEAQVLYRHVFRNSLLPLITVAAALLPGLLGGSVIIESLFGIEGMGKLAISAVQSRDRELIMSITVISGVLILIGNLLADICYAFADPRVSYD